MGSGLSVSKRGYEKAAKMPDCEKVYREALQKDPDVKNSHDNVLQADMDTPERARDPDHWPLEALKVLILYLAELDKYLNNLILRNEKDIKKNRKLSALVDRYNQLNDKTLKNYNDLSKWAYRASRNLLVLKVALGYIEPADPPPAKEKYIKCSEKLREYNTAQNLLGKELFNLLDSLYAQHKQIWEDLEAERKKSAAKLKGVRMWRKFSNIIFAAAFAAMLVCSMVAAVMAAPPLAAAVGAALPIGSIGEWLNRRLTKNEKKLKVENEVIERMQQRTDSGLCELNIMSNRVKRLDDTICSILDDIDFYCKEEDHQKVAAEDIREKLPTLKDKIDKLKDRLDFMREKRQSVEDAMKDMKKEQQSLKQKLDHVMATLDLSDQDAQVNCVRVNLFKNTRYDMSPFLQPWRNGDMKDNPKPTWCNDFIHLIKLFQNNYNYRD